jgi:expansin (peptidoglycan-binding protein)
VAAALLVLALPAMAAADGVPDCPGELFVDLGIATFYFPAGNPVACTLDSPPPGSGYLTTAVSPAEFAGSANCGRCLDVWGPLGHVLVRISDECPGCATGHLDLDDQAFATIADPLQGVVPIAYRSTECPVAGNVSWLFQGSNPYYLKLQIRDHPYRVATLEVTWSGGGGFHAMTRTGDNFFEYSQAQPIPFPITVRATDLYGHVLTDAIQDLVNDVVIAGHAQFALCTGIFVDGFETGTATPRWSLAEPYAPPAPPPRAAQGAIVRRSPDE